MARACSETNVQLSVKDLSVDHAGVQSIKNVSFTVVPQQVVGLVGESGAGKSTVLRSIVKLLSPAAKISSGQIIFEGQDILALSDEELTDIRGKRIATIFQNPGSSLDPSMRIGKQIIEVMRQHLDLSKHQARAQAIDLLDRMGLPNAEALCRAYSFELSGGMQQRVAIALAMAFKPALLLADEPTSALDSTTQLAIVKELLRLRDVFGVSILLVTHNIGLAHHICDDIHVMKDGYIVESGSAERVIKNPQSELARQLIDAVSQVV
jgi:peptide/nickel transport system ATP-binding protein